MQIKPYNKVVLVGTSCSLPSRVKQDREINPSFLLVSFHFETETLLLFQMFPRLTGQAAPVVFTCTPHRNSKTA
jgi:hypothetical protein